MQDKENFFHKKLTKLSNLTDKLYLKDKSYLTDIKCEFADEYKELYNEIKTFYQYALPVNIKKELISIKRMRNTYMQEQIQNFQHEAKNIKNFSHYEFQFKYQLLRYETKNLYSFFSDKRAEIEEQFEKIKNIRNQAILEDQKKINEKINKLKHKIKVMTIEEYKQIKKKYNKLYTHADERYNPDSKESKKIIQKLEKVKEIENFKKIKEKRKLSKLKNELQQKQEKKLELESDLQKEKKFLSKEIEEMNIKWTQKDLTEIKEEIKEEIIKLKKYIDITEEEIDKILPIASDPDETKQNDYNENI